MSDTALPKGRVKKYHKRSLWACDECKLRKKKCDGSQPCKTCNLYGSECTYESRTRPSRPPTQRIRELEEDIRSVRDLLGRIKPGLSGSSLLEVEQTLSTLKPAAEGPAQLELPTSEDVSAPEPLRSMLVGRGRLLQSAGRTFFHGPYSGPAVICSVLDFFGGTSSVEMHAHVIELFDLAGVEPGMGATRLPERAQTAALFDVVLRQTHPFFQFLDAITLETLIRDLYDVPWVGHTEQYMDNLALCHIVLALGWMLDVSKHGLSRCESAVAEAHEHFLASRRMLDLTAVNDMIRLKTVLCSIVFHVCKSWPSTAYTYISVASTSAIRQGLHIKHGTRTTIEGSRDSGHDQLLTTLVNMDLYVSTVLGFPPIINIDTAGTTLGTTRESSLNARPRSQGYFGDYTGRLDSPTPSSDLASKYYQIVSLTASVLWDFSSASTDGHTTGAGVSEVDAAILNRAEKELSIWTRGIGIAVSPSAPDSDDVPINISIARHELELSFYWSQLLLYLPFLHYLRPLADGQPVPESMSRPALTCLKIAVNTIVRCEALLECLSVSDAYSYFMHPSNLTCIYTVFLAVLALIFLISIHEGTSKPGEAWRRAETGIKILASLKCQEGGARPCLAVIKDMVRQLNYTVDFDIEEIERMTTTVCQRNAGHGVGSSAHNTASGQAQQPTAQQYFQAQDVAMVVENQTAELALEVPDLLSSADAMLAKAQGMPTTTESAAEEP